MWELDCEESWALKNWCFWTVVLEKTLESPLDCKEIQTVHSKGDQSWVFFGKNDAKVETPVLWPPRVKSWLIGKDSDAGRVWGQEEKGTKEDEMAGWHYWLDGHEFGWTPEVGDGQGGQACCDSWGPKSRTWLTNWTELKDYPNSDIHQNTVFLLGKQTLNENCIPHVFIMVNTNFDHNWLVADRCKPQFCGRTAKWREVSCEGFWGAKTSQLNNFASSSYSKHNPVIESEGLDKFKTRPILA